MSGKVNKFKSVLVSLRKDVGSTRIVTDVIDKCKIAKDRGAWELNVKEARVFLGP